MFSVDVMVMAGLENNSPQASFPDPTLPFQTLPFCCHRCISKIITQLMKLSHVNTCGSFSIQSTDIKIVVKVIVFYYLPQPTIP